MEYHRGWSRPARRWKNTPVRNDKVAAEHLSQIKDLLDEARAAEPKPHRGPVVPCAHEFVPDGPSDRCTKCHITVEGNIDDGRFLPEGHPYEEWSDR